jgi:ribosome-binding factor A
MSRRTERVGSAIRQEVMEVIQRELHDPRLDGLLPSVNRVKVAEDLSTADVYMVMMGTPGKQTAGLAALRHAAGMIRGRLGKALSTRTVPYLRFHQDEAYRKEIEVLELIRKAEDEFSDREPEAGAAGSAEGETDSTMSAEAERRE